MKIPGSKLWVLRAVLPLLIVISGTIWIWWSRLEERSVKIKRLERPATLAGTESLELRKNGRDGFIDKVTFKDITKRPPSVQVATEKDYAPCPALKRNETVKNILLYTPFFE